MFTFLFFFFFNDTATTEIYTLSLHDALPIWRFTGWRQALCAHVGARAGHRGRSRDGRRLCRSEEHTSELQSRSDLVCRLLLEKKKKKIKSKSDCRWNYTHRHVDARVLVQNHD